MEALILICSIISGIISLFAIGLSLNAIITVKALQASTHKIQWMPIDDPYKNKEEDIEEVFDELNNPIT